MLLELHANLGWNCIQSSTYDGENAAKHNNVISRTPIRMINSKEMTLKCCKKLVLRGKSAPNNQLHLAYPHGMLLQKYYTAEECFWFHGYWQINFFLTLILLKYFLLPRKHFAFTSYACIHPFPFICHKRNITTSYFPFGQCIILLLMCKCPALQSWCNVWLLQP